MFRFNRRALILSAVAGTAFALAGCKTTTNPDGSTSSSLDTKKIFNYGTAITNAATMIISAFAGVPGFTKYTNLAEVILSNATEALNQLKSVVGDSVTIDLSSGSTKSTIDSIIDNGLYLIDLAMNIATEVDLVRENVPGSAVNTISSVLPALKTIVSIFKTLVSGVVDTASGAISMPEEYALTVLNVKAHPEL